MAGQRLAVAVLPVLFLAAWTASAGAVTIDKVTSPGGITAWLVEDHSLPIVSLDVTFRGGASLDPPNEAGLATLTMDLLDEGAGDLDSSAYQGKLEDLATSMEFSASHDTVDVDMRSTSGNLAESLDLLRLALLRPRFDSDAVSRVRGQLVAAVAHEAHDPHYIAERLLWNRAFEGHPYAQAVRGTPETIGHIGVADLRRFAAERFGRDVMLVSVVGDITPEALKAILDKTFGDLPAKAAAAAETDVAPRTSDDLLLANLPIPQSVVAFGQPGIKRDDPDWYAALLVNYVLGGGGLTSRLALEVREKRGLAYSVSTALEPLEHSGMLLGIVGTENAHVAQSIDIIRAEWKRMRDDGPTEKELADAKKYLTGSFPLSFDSTTRLASLLIALEEDRLGIDYIDKRAALINQVTLDDAKRVAKRLLDPAALSFVVVGAPQPIAGAHIVSANDL
jgi:zinc protease